MKTVDIPAKESETVEFKSTFNAECIETGFQRIRKAVVDDPTMKFTYREAQGGFLVELSYETQKDSTEKNVEKGYVTENVPENVTGNVTGKREQVILQLLHSDPIISTSEFATKLGVTRRTVHRDLEKLKEKGVLERVGPDKGGSWKILK